MAIGQYGILYGARMSISAPINRRDTTVAQLVRERRPKPRRRAHALNLAGLDMSEFKPGSETLSQFLARKIREKRKKQKNA